MSEQTAALIKQLEDPSDEQRMFAAEDLSYANDPDVVAALIARLQREEEQVVKEAIALALERIDGPRVVAASLPLLSSEDPYVRNLAVELLRKGGQAQADALLAFLSEQKDPDIRKFIMDIAAQFDNPAAMRFLHLGLTDEDVNVVIAAVEYIGQKELRPLREAIEETFLAAQEPMLVATCLETLAAVGDAATLTLVARRFPDLGRADPVYLVPLLKLYGRLGGPEHLELFDKMLAGPTLLKDDILACAILPIHLRHAITPLPPELEEAIGRVLGHDADPADAGPVLMFLGLRRLDPQISALLHQLLNAPHPITRLHAITAWSLNPDESARAALAQRLAREPDPAVKEALRHALRAQ